EATEDASAEHPRAASRRLPRDFAPPAPEPVAHPACRLRENQRLRAVLRSLQGNRRDAAELKSSAQAHWPGVERAGCLPSQTTVQILQLLLFGPLQSSH